MTDETLRDADPYRPEVMNHLDGADEDLLDEIFSGRRPSFLRRFAAPIAAAAAVAGVLGVVALHHQAGPVTPAVAQSAAQSASQSATQSATQSAEDNPRLLIQEPGWKATTVYGFADKSGTISFANGVRELEFDWYPASAYQSYYIDRLDVSAPAPATVDGMAGDRFTYSATDYAVMLKPRNGLFVEMRTGTEGWTLASFEQTLTHIKQVDAATFLAAMPPEIVTPDRAAAAADRVLADIPLPPGFDRSVLQGFGADDQYQFGAETTKVVGCGWIADWKTARATGNTTEVKRAATAMKSSHHWAVLKQMESEGAWSQSFWEIADHLAAGRLQPGTEESLECH